MNIATLVQDCFHKQSVLKINIPCELARSHLETISKTEITHGNPRNPFITSYQLNLEWDDNRGVIAGPVGHKHTALISKIAIQPTNDATRNTRIAIDSRMAPKDVNINIFATIAITIYLVIAIHKPELKQIGLVTYYLFVYGVTWISVHTSHQIVRKSLLESLQTINPAISELTN